MFETIVQSKLVWMMMVAESHLLFVSVLVQSYSQPIETEVTSGSV